jgi:hypothetical protein
MEKIFEKFHLDKWNLAKYNIVDMPTSFICLVITLDKGFKHGDGAKFLVFFFFFFFGTNAEQSV